MYELEIRDTLPISENRYMSLISVHIALNPAKKIMNFIKLDIFFRKKFKLVLISCKIPMF